MKFFAVLSAVLAVAVASPAAWTLQDVTEAIQDYSSDEHLMPYLEHALNELMDQIYAGNPAPTTTISSIVEDFSVWTLEELSLAIEDPATNLDLIPYLEHGLNTLIYNIHSGNDQLYIIIGTPIGILPVEVVAPIVPAPVEESVVPTPIEGPAVPTPVEAPVVPAPASSPLVQLIVNVNSQQAVAPAPVVVPSPVVIPSPAVVPNPDFIAVHPISMNPRA